MSVTVNSANQKTANTAENAQANLTPDGEEKRRVHATTSIDEAAECLHRGGLLVFPTETVCALGCLACSWDAAARVYKIKQRIIERTLPVIAGEISQLEDIVNLSAAPEGLLERYWPGPLTVILPILDSPPPTFANLLIRGLAVNGTLAVRVTSHPHTASLAKKAGLLTSSSANISGQAPAVAVKEVDPSIFNALYRPEDRVFNASAKDASGISSTIIEPTESGIVVVREGTITAAELTEAGYTLLETSEAERNMLGGSGDDI